MAEVACPICPFRDESDYVVRLHIEQSHDHDDPPMEAQFAQRVPPHHSNGTETAQTSLRSSEEWLKCTRTGCGEYVHLSDFDEHLEMHNAIAAVEEQEVGVETRRPRRSPKSSPEPSKSSDEDRPSTSGHDGTATSRIQREGRPPPLPERKPKSTQDSPKKLQKQHPRPPQSSGNHSLLSYLAGTSYRGTSRPSSRATLYSRLQKPQEPGRLGKHELGPYAFEDAMPATVRRHLLEDAVPYCVNRIGRNGRLEKERVVENETPGIIPVLADICDLVESTQVTYLCHPATRHIHKIQCDGNFCGYWNIQMLLTYLWRRHEDRRGRPRPVEDVLRIQDTIEKAWDEGVCSYGRVETGGIRNTRKWIGTHEALAYFTQIGVHVDALSFHNNNLDPSSSSAAAAAPSNEAEPTPAAFALLDHIEAYFMSGLDDARRSGSSYTTRRPPLYFQRFGHSMTIIGLERRKDGGRNLLVFDSSFGTTQAMWKLIDGKHVRVRPSTILEPYRRSEESLMRWKEFEVIVPRIDES